MRVIYVVLRKYITDGKCDYFKLSLGENTSTTLLVA